MEDHAQISSMKCNSVQDFAGASQGYKDVKQSKAIERQSHTQPNIRHLRRPRARSGRCGNYIGFEPVTCLRPARVNGFHLYLRKWSIFLLHRKGGILMMWIKTALVCLDD